MEQLRIQLVNARWTVNGRNYSEMSFLERELLDKAITGLQKEIEYYKSIALEVNGYEIITK